MERFIQSIKTSQGERYEVMLSISKEAYGIQWYFAKDVVKLSGIVMSTGICQYAYDVTPLLVVIPND